MSSVDSAVLYAARGLGIILVVIGHVTTGPQNAFIYLFHMPLFFLLSGIAARQFGAPDSTGTIKRLKSMIVPTIVAASVILSVYAINRTSYGAPALAGAFSAYWFIASLCMIVIALFALGDSAQRYWPVLVSVVAGIGLAIHFPLVDRLPRTVLGAAFGLQFFLVGYLIPWQMYRKRSLWTVALGVLAVASLVWGSQPVDIATKNYGLPFVSPVYATVISLACIALFFYAPHYLRGLIAKVGQASLLVLLYHQAIHLLLRRFAPDLPTLLVLAISIAVPTLTYHALRGRGVVSVWVGAR